MCCWRVSRSLHAAAIHINIYLLIESALTLYLAVSTRKETRWAALRDKSRRVCWWLMHSCNPPPPSDISISVAVFLESWDLGASATFPFHQKRQGCQGTEMDCFFSSFLIWIVDLIQFKLHLLIFTSVVLQIRLFLNFNPSLNTIQT